MRRRAGGEHDQRLRRHPLGTGLPRQFQYEQTQSRIGGTLWEEPMRFIENSPMFFADR